MLLKEKWKERYVTGRRERRRKQLMKDLKETREYCKLKKAALDCTLEETMRLS
jgi:hypothetical protein